jgi:hypothetical protein
VATAIILFLSAGVSPTPVVAFTKISFSNVYGAAEAFLCRVGVFISVISNSSILDDSLLGRCSRLLSLWLVYLHLSAAPLLKVPERKKYFV